MLERMHRCKMRMQSKKEFATTQEVYDKALDLLALRDHGEQDMYEKLILKGATTQQAREAVEQLKRAGLINELQYGMAVYRGWLAKASYGRQHLIGTLTKKLVAKSCWSEILENFTSELEEENARRAAEVFHNKYWNKHFENKRKLWATAAAFMVNRGFGADYMDLVLEKFQIDSPNVYYD